MAVILSYSSANVNASQKGKKRSYYRLKTITASHAVPPLTYSHGNAPLAVIGHRHFQRLALHVIDENEAALSLADERIEQAIIKMSAKLFILDPLQAYTRLAASAR